MSEVPPGANGTTMRTALRGAHSVSAARAASGAPSAAPPAAIRPTARRRPGSASPGTSLRILVCMAVSLPSKGDPCQAVVFR